jgi:SepF-like predicted cell division protein (DUF552 family)
MKKGKINSILKKKEKLNKYFVSYLKATYEEEYSFHSNTVHTNRIRDYNDVNDLQKELEKELECKQILILSWRLFE